MRTRSRFVLSTLTAPDLEVEEPVWMVPPTSPEPPWPPAPPEPVLALPLPPPVALALPLSPPSSPSPPVEPAFQYVMQWKP